MPANVDLSNFTLEQIAELAQQPGRLGRSAQEYLRNPPRPTPGSPPPLPTYEGQDAAAAATANAAALVTGMNAVLVSLQPKLQAAIDAAADQPDVDATHLEAVVEAVTPLSPTE